MHAAVLVAFAVVIVALSIGAGCVVGDWRRGRRVGPKE